MSLSETASGERPEWMEAPRSPLTDEQIKALAVAQVADTDFEMNEVYMNKADSLAVHGEMVTVALDTLDRLRELLREAAPIVAAPLRHGRHGRTSYFRELTERIWEALGDV